MPRLAYASTASAAQRSQTEPEPTAAAIPTPADSNTGGSPLPIHPQHPGKAATASLPVADALLTSDGQVDVAALTIPAVVADPLLKVVKPTASDIRDSELMFRTVWNDLLEKYGEEQLAFPKNIMWLAGAPGAGKGAMTPLIMDYRDITARPVEVGALLTSVEALAMKAAGKLVGDRQVIELLFETLLKPEYQSGVLVDGFPRTKEQAECIKLLYDQMNVLRRKYAQTALYHKFHRPIFHITVLYIDKDESIRRQLRRGKLAQIHNDVVAATGVGELKPVRETDLISSLAEERYRIFKQQVYESLKYVKEKFHFHFINAEGAPTEVQARILKELRYQSSMELGDETFERLRKIPLASEIILNARYELVRRLDNYKARYADLFDAVIAVIMSEFLHIVRRQALSGRAIIRSNNTVFNEKIAVDMALDLLTERGYTVVLDIKKKQQPARVDPATGDIQLREVRVFEFQIDFARPSIRRG